MICMDDDKINPEENQSGTTQSQPPPSETRPIFQTTPIEPATETPPPPPVSEESLQPEEIAPELETPEQAAAPSAPFEIPMEPPPQGPPSDTRNKFLILGGGVVLFLIFFILLVSLVLGGRKAAKGQIKLTYWGLWEEKSTLDPLIKQYEAKNKNITIDYQKMDVQDYREKLVARSQKNQGPDLFRFHNTWLPEIKEVLAPLPASVMSASEFDKTFYSIHKKDLKIGDSYFGIPLTIDGLVLIYNDNLFKKAGITNPPATWDDLFDDAIKLTVKDSDGKIITSGIALGTASNIEHFSDIFGLFLVQNGVTLKELDQPEAAQALEAYRKFAEPPDNVWDESMPNSIAAFSQEKVAMIIIPSWEILTIKNINPDLALKTIPIPVIPGAGTEPKSLATYWIEGVSRSSKNQLEAWKFLKYLSEKENITKLYENESKNRLFGEPYSRVDLANLMTENEYTGVVVKQAPNFVTVPVISRTFDHGLNDEVNKYIEDAINATEQGVTYSSALQTAKEGIDQVFKKFEIQ